MEGDVQSLTVFLGNRNGFPSIAFDSLVDEDGREGGLGEVFLDRTQDLEEGHTVLSPGEGEGDVVVGPKHLETGNSVSRPLLNRLGETRSTQALTRVGASVDSLVIAD